MSEEQSKVESSDQKEASSSKHENQHDADVSNDSFKTALDTMPHSKESFQTARSQLDPVEVEERLNQVRVQDRTRTIASLVSIAEEHEEHTEDEDEENAKRIHFIDEIDSKTAKRSDQATSSASMPQQKSEPRTYVTTDNDDDENEHVEQVERLTRMTDSSHERIAQLQQPVLKRSLSDSDIDELGNLGKVQMTPSPLHMGLDRKSNHLERSSHSLRSHGGLGGGHAFIYMVIPPDGGYGWLITFISFLAQVVVDGIIFGIGIVLPDMAEDLEVKASSIALVASMQIGPISCAFINKYGFRPVALCGATISATSITIASFSPNLTMLIFFYSLIGGVSLSMVWVSSQLIIGYYFEKYRPIANGLSCSGAGAGILTFSAMNSALVSEIGWRNVLRVHVIFLVCVFFMAFTFIEVPPRKIGQIFEEPSDSMTESSEYDDFQNQHRYSKTSTYSSYSRVEEKGIPDMIEPYEEYAYTYKKPNLFARCCAKCCGKCFPAVRGRPSMSAPTDTKRYVIRTDPMEKQDLYYMGPADYDHNREELLQDVVEGKQVEIVGGSHKKARGVNYRLSMLQGTRTAEKDREGVGRHFKCLSPKNWLPKKVVNAFAVLFDVRLLRMMEFQILLASAFFYPMGFNIPFVFSKVRANLPVQQTSLISPAIGLSNFAFRIGSGFIAYKYKEYTTYICGGGIAFGGMAVVISAFYGADIFWFQMVYAVSFGIAPAFYSTLRAIIYVRALGLDKLTNAFGLTAMAMGTGVFIGTTLAAFLNQETGSYFAAFIFGGSCMVLAGMLKLLLPSIMKWQKARLARKEAKVKISS